MTAPKEVAVAAAETRSLSPILSDAPPLPALFRGVEIYDRFDDEDLRETSKFSETTNVLGIAIHPIGRPTGDASILEIRGRLDAIPVTSGDAKEMLRGLIVGRPWILARGLLAAGCSRPARIAGLFPYDRAELAAAFRAATTPDPAAAGPADLYVVQIPHAPDRLIAHMPDIRLALALGTDDPRAALPIAIEAANRLWRERTARNLEGGGSHDRDPRGAKWEEIRLLAGGCFAANSPALPASSGSSAVPSPTLIFTSETAPNAWEESLASLDILAAAGVSTSDVLVAQAEPWVAEGGGVVCPLFRNPPLAARILAGSARWRAAAEAPGALGFGLPVDSRGRVRIEDAPEDACVVVPREAVPAPFAASAAPARVGRVVAHGIAKNEARELWARGFPAATIAD